MNKEKQKEYSERMVVSDTFIKHKRKGMRENMLDKDKRKQGNLVLGKQSDRFG